MRLVRPVHTQLPAGVATEQPTKAAHSLSDLGVHELPGHEVWLVGWGEDVVRSRETRRAHGSRKRTTAIVCSESSAQVRVAYASNGAISNVQSMLPGLFSNML